MKRLSEYIENKSIESKLFLNSNFDFLNEYFCNDIPCDVLELWDNRDLRFDEWILESLKSHDIEGLKRKIEREYPKNIRDISIENKQNKTGLLYIRFDKQLSIQNSQGFKNIINFFNYILTDNSDGYIVLEPEYPDKCNDECKKQFKNKFIHVTTKEYADKILKCGLRCRSSKENCRKYSSRIQLKCATSEKDALDFAKELKSIRMNNPIDSDAKLWNNTCILGVDLYSLHLDIYRDHMYDESEHCYFVKNNIPSKYIKLLYKDI